MSTTTSVKGILEDASGRAISGATVMITAGPGEFNEVASITNDSGQFSLPNITVPGNYTLQIEGPTGTKIEEVNLAGRDTIHIRF